jgi:Domain of unknown function (DUF4350)
MKLLSSLDARDRKLLLGCLAAALSLAVAIGMLLPSANSDDNPVPSTYVAGQHGARAAYETLLGANYPIERWERPLSDLAAVAGPETVVIFAEPFSRETDDIRAMRQIVEKGGRVLATGYWGGSILPGGMPNTSRVFNFAACQLEPEGLDTLANSGDVWMVPQASWQVGNPSHRIQYGCAGQPAVVEYEYGKGHVVWWASSTPLENGFLARGNDLDLLLNSIGPLAGHHFYWDESLHGDVRSTWSYASGPARNLLLIGLPLLGFLIVFSFSRRSGPMRELPQPVRGAPVEFLEALGSLYRNAGASSTAIAVALERFRRQALRLCGLRPTPMPAAELAAVIRRRFPNIDERLEADLAASEEATWNEAIEPRAALKLIQALHMHRAKLAEAARLGGPSMQTQPIHSSTQERAS